MKRVALGVLLATCAISAQGADPVIVPAVRTTPLPAYEDAPATPDADDPAVWINHADVRRSLVIGTAKDAGLLVYNLSGRLVQALLPPNAPQVLEADPPTPGGVNLSPDDPCPGSDSGETFGRFNNVDIAYDVRLGPGPRAPRADVAIVSDRGCDRVRFFRIDLTNPDGPLVDITAPNVPRVFPRRYDQPSATQPSSGVERWRDNPVDDQNTVYGLTVAQGDGTEVFVTQRERGLVRQLRVESTLSGRLTYRLVRTFLFDTSFDLEDQHQARYSWTPCREAVEEEPQSEGLVYDSVNDTLYVAFETIGLYRIPLTPWTPDSVRVGVNRLVEPVRSFGQAYHASPDEDEFECEYDPKDEPNADDIVAIGSNANAGEFLQADLEGLAIIAQLPGQVVMLASSQGDSSFHFYRIRGDNPRHLGSFLIEGVGDTDGVHFAPAQIRSRYPLGFLVVQNGEAPEPPDTGDINGYEFDGATQFLYVDFAEALKALKN